MTALEQLRDADRARLRPAQGHGWREPMLATLTDDPFSHEDWIFERKLDGVRAVSSSGGSGPVIWSRNRKKMNGSYPELESALREHVREDLVVDGEIVAFQGNQTSFERLQQRIHVTDPRRIAASEVTVYYYLFDILEYAGYDLTRIPLRTRKRILQHAVDFADPLRYSPHRNAAGEQSYRQACARGWEGVIAKRANASYRHGRSKDWLKFKCTASQELVIGGFTEPRGSRRGFGALLVGYYQGETLRYAGKVGTGYDEALLRSLRSQLDDLEVRSRPFGESVAENGAHWVEPRLVAQIGFAEWTEDGKLRHPRFQGLRHDKNAKAVVREAR